MIPLRIVLAGNLPQNFPRNDRSGQVHGLTWTDDAPQPVA